MIDDDYSFNPLPTYQGGKDKTTANRMLQRIGGQDAIRKDYVTNADGSVTMAHTRGAGAAPEIVTTGGNGAGVGASGSKWAWPWHGMYRVNTDDEDVVQTFDEITTSSLRGYLPRGLADHDWNFICTVTTPENTPAAAITPPSGADPSQVWVNYATVYEGVLFGTYVGPNVWLCVLNGVCYVAKQTTIDLVVTLDFYTLDVWVSSMPSDTAQDFVKYNKTPVSVFMVTGRPSGADLTVYQTVYIDLPPYDKSIDTAAEILRIKRTAASQDGGKVTLAYEVSGKANGYTTNASPLGVVCNRLAVEAMWVELTITMDNHGVISVASRQLGTCQASATGNTIEFDETMGGGSASRSRITTGSKSYTVGYMYNPDGNATPVTLQQTWNLDHSVAATVTEWGSLGEPPVSVAYGTESDAVGSDSVVTQISFNGSHVDSSFVGSWDVHQGNGTYYRPSPNPYNHGLNIGALTVQFNGTTLYSGKYSIGVGASGSNGFAAQDVLLITAEAAEGFVNGSIGVPGSISNTTTDHYTTSPMSVRRFVNELSTLHVIRLFGSVDPEAYVPSDAKAGLRAWYTTKSTYLTQDTFPIPGWPAADIQADPGSPVIGNGVSAARPVLLRDSPNGYSLCVERERVGRLPDEEDYLPGGLYATYFEPLAHLTPYGWVMPATPPTYDAVIGGWSYSLGELAMLVQSGEVVFDGNGRCVTDKVIKYAKQDGAKHNTRRCI